MSDPTEAGVAVDRLNADVTIASYAVRKKLEWFGPSVYADI